jgi:hypothetical protein
LQGHQGIEVICTVPRKTLRIGGKLEALPEKMQPGDAKNLGNVTDFRKFAAILRSNKAESGVFSPSGPWDLTMGYLRPSYS